MLFRSVAVDLRRGSKSFGKWEGVRLSDENKRQFYVPAGFAHGFLVLSESAQFCYKCTDFYHPEDEGGLLWNDPDVAVNWPKTDFEYLLSDKDRALPTLSSAAVHVFDL